MTVGAVVILCAAREVEIQARDLVKKDQSVFTKNHEMGMVQKLLAIPAISFHSVSERLATIKTSTLKLMRITIAHKAVMAPTLQERAEKCRKIKV
jgi:hypothetical protein